MRTIHNYRNLITPVINRILSRTIKCSKAHNLNASASVEGAIVIPLFIYAVMSIMFIMQVIAVRIHINNAIYTIFVGVISVLCYWWWNYIKNFITVTVVSV
jgi:protein-S-isoprenylcysteine O-methyltransferase Ste14